MILSSKENVEFEISEIEDRRGGGGEELFPSWENPRERGWERSYQFPLSSQSMVLAPVVRKVDNAIHRINLYPVDKC